MAVVYRHHNCQHECAFNHLLDDSPSTHRRIHLSTLILVTRQCSRPGCAEAAVATFTYQYARSVVWLDELSHDRDPHGYDLCDRHASRLGVPYGWRLDDRRRARHLQLLAG